MTPSLNKEVNIDVLTTKCYQRLTSKEEEDEAAMDAGSSEDDKDKEDEARDKK